MNWWSFVRLIQKMDSLFEKNISSVHCDTDTKQTTISPDVYIEAWAVKLKAKPQALTQYSEPNW